MTLKELKLLLDLIPTDLEDVQVIMQNEPGLYSVDEVNTYEPRKGEWFPPFVVLVSLPAGAEPSGPLLISYQDVTVRAH